MKKKNRERKEIQKRQNIEIKKKRLKKYYKK